MEKQKKLNLLFNFALVSKKMKYPTQLHSGAFRFLKDQPVESIKPLGGKEQSPIICQEDEQLKIYYSHSS